MKIDVRFVSRMPVIKALTHSIKHRLIKTRFAGIWLIAVATTASTAAAERGELIFPTDTDNAFHFVVLGDAQFHNPAKFNRVIDQARALRPAFVVQVGDLIQGYQDDLEAIQQEWWRFKKQVGPLEHIPYLPLPGNHDLFNGQTKVDASLERLYTKNWGPLYYAFNYKNALLLMLNSDSVGATNQISDEQLTWLTSKLSESRDTHKFVFMHRPPALTKNSDALHALFVKHGVSHVFYGHHHHYHNYQRDGVNYTMTNASGNSAHEHDAIGGFHHLLQVSVHNEEVNIAVVKADGMVSSTSVHPSDNYDYYALTQRLAPERIELNSRGDRQYEFDITLSNPTGRTLSIMISCDSEDGRWAFQPKALEPVELGAKATKSVSVLTEFSQTRQPESTPMCQLRVPFQTQNGQWIEYQQKIEMVR